MNTSENKSPLGAVVAALTPDPKNTRSTGVHAATDMLGTEGSFRKSSYPHQSRGSVAAVDAAPAMPAATTTAAPGAPTAAPAGPGTGAPVRARSRNRPISRMKRPEHRRIRPSTSQPLTKRENEIPLVGQNIRIIPLGGVEEIGKNMTAIEIGDDIIVIDAGFQFKEEGTPGIDYILPNTRYLEDRKDRVRAMIITHAHLDHIGGLPFIMDRIGNPPLYTRNLSALMIKKRQTEFPHLPPVDYKIVEKNEKLKIGNLIVSFFGVTHTIPDSMGIIIETPYGAVVTPGDYKLEHTDGIPSEREEKEYKVFDTMNVLCMLSDSTNVANPGFSTPERLVHENLDEIIKSIKGRLIVGLFASQLERIINMIMSAEKYGKKVVVEGRTMKTNVEIATLAGLLNVKKDTIIDARDMDKYAPDKIVVIATGAQGDEFAALSRMSVKNYKYLQLTPRDTVLLSSSIIPGNEKAVQKLKDNLSRQGAKIIEYRTSDVYIHSTGHGNRGEIEWLHRKIKPKFFIPIHGSHYMLKLHAQLAMDLGMKEENIVVPDDGTIIEIQDEGKKMVVLKEKAPSAAVTVDGFTVGDIQEVVMRDRQILSQDGIFVIFALLDQKTGKIRQSPDIISRGSVYLQESQDILREVRFIIKRSIERNINLNAAPRPGAQVRTDNDGNNINFDYVKNIVNDEVGRFLFQETAKKPIIITVIRTV